MDKLDSFDILLDVDRDGCFDSKYIKKLFKKRRYLVELEKREILANPGDILTDCYYVDSGVIVSYEKVGNSKRLYDYFDSGMFIFIEETVLNYPSSLTYEAVTSVQLYSIGVDFVRKLWINNWQFAHHCMKQMSRDYLQMRSQIRKETCHSADWRVANIILELATKEGMINENRVTLKKHKKSHLADLLHMNRVTFYKCFSNIEERNLCRIKNGFIEVIDIDELKKYRDSLYR